MLERKVSRAGALGIALLGFATFASGAGVALPVPEPVVSGVTVPIAAIGRPAAGDRLPAGAFCLYQPRAPTEAIG